MTYQEARTHTFASGTVPDGYFGDTATVEFAYDPASGKTLVIHAHGYYTAPIPPALDSKEALYMLKYHPSARHITLNPAYR